MLDGETEGVLLSRAVSPIAQLEHSPVPASLTADLEDRLVDAMLDCIGRWGVAKTTADDIARAAGVSRATFYRAFPGGMDVAFGTLVRREVTRFFERVSGPLGSATTLEDLLVTGAVEAADFMLGHEALVYVLENERDRVLPPFATQHLGDALAVATAFVTPHLARFMRDPADAAEGAEYVSRLLLSYALDPSPTLDLTDPSSVRRFVCRYALPALEN